MFSRPPEIEVPTSASKPREVLWISFPGMSPIWGIKKGMYNQLGQPRIPSHLSYCFLWVKLRLDQRLNHVNVPNPKLADEANPLVFVSCSRGC